MYAAALFGSASRQDTDTASDKDLLLVSGARSRFIFKQLLEKVGFSVSVYSPAQLFHMRTRGALFLQHLRYEAKVLFDHQGSLQTFLSTCELVGPTKAELLRARLECDLIMEWPDLEYLRPWKLDVAYSLTRDLLIKRLAGTGHLAFGLDDLEHQYQQIFAIPRGSFAGLRRARLVKCEYRAGRSQSIPDYGDILASLAELHTVVDSSARLGCAGSVRAHLQRALELGVSTYTLLRNLEAALLVCDTLRLKLPERSLAWRMIRDPNGYQATSHQRRGRVHAYLDTAIKLLHGSGDLTLSLTPKSPVVAIALPADSSANPTQGRELALCSLPGDRISGSQTLSQSSPLHQRISSGRGSFAATPKPLMNGSFLVSPAVVS